MTTNRILRRNLLIGTGALAGVALVGGAAFVAGGLLSQQRGPARPGGGPGEVISISAGPGAVAKELRPNIKPAAGVPDGPPNAHGVFKQRNDNSLLIGTGEIEMKVIRDESGRTKAEATTNGPTVEVVVSRDTELLQDITQMDMAMLSEGREIQQVLEKLPNIEALAAKIDTTTTLQVWGPRNGERINAKVIVFRAPLLLRVPGG